jgi:hypothetical protein
VCTNGICNSVFDVSSSLCPSTGLSVTVLATNLLGDSEASDEIVVGQLVQYNYNYYHNFL